MADLTITASSVLPSSTALIDHQRVAGVEINAGQFVYLDSGSPQKWQLVDADLATGTEITREFGVACNHAYANQPISVAKVDSDFTPGATLVTGTTYAASTTPGGIAPVSDLTTGDYVVILGVAKSTTKLNLNPAASGAAI